MRASDGERSTPHIAVVGAGISGLAAAWALRRDAGDQVRVTILESSPTVGGKLRVGEVGGVPVDLGAEAMLARRREAVDLARAVGLGDELEPPATSAASVWTRRRLRPLPQRQLLGVPGDLRALAASRVLSPAGLARVPLDLVLPATPIETDVAVGSYVAARLGREVVDRLVEPLLGGVYAGSPDTLSMDVTVPQLALAARQERSLLLAARAVLAASASDGGLTPVFAGIREGVGRLAPEVAAASAAVVRTSCTVRGLQPTETGWRLVIGSTASPELVDADAVVLAVPGRPASRLLADVAPDEAAALGRLDYASVALVTLAFPVRALDRALAGSGFLVPTVERLSIKAATYASNKWSWLSEAAPDTVVVRASLGRYGDAQVLQRDDQDLVTLARSDLQTVAGIDALPVDATVTRWGGSLPQYAVGHRNLVARIRAATGRLPGLAVCGAAYDGVGIPACIASGEAAAARVLQQLRPEEQWAHGHPGDG